jgi:hypothetical protein
MQKRWAIVVLMLAAGVAANAYPTGISGRTQKNTTAGCGGGGCHGSGPNTGVTVAITGPDTVIVGQNASYTITVTGTTGTAGGCDIASSRGTLAPVSTVLKSLSGDVTHKQRCASPWNYVVTFTAPATAGHDTLYANGKDNGFTRWNWAPKKVLTIIAATGVDDNGGTSPLSYSLQQNYPNPFNGETRIQYRVAGSGSSDFVSLKVYNLLGSEVATLVNGVKEPGEHTVNWATGSLASGVYIYRLMMNGQTVAARKMVLTR